MIKVLYQFFFKSKTPLIKISIIILPILLTLVIASMLFIHNILYSYKNYLEKSYIGLQPKIYIESTPKLINKLFVYTQKHHITASKAIHIYKILKLNNYKKKIEFIVLNKNFMMKKFHTTIAINNILAKEIKSKSIISSKKMKKNLIITNKYIIPTGFLTNSSIIFISKNKYKKYFKSIPNETILEIEDNFNFKNIVYKYAKELGTMKLVIHKRINQIKNSKELFEKIDKIKNIIIILIFIFAISIITISFSIIIEIKRKEIKILHKIGISKNKFYLFLLSITLIISSLSVLFGYLFYILSISFLKRFLTDTYDFVIISDNHFILSIILFIPITLLIVFVSLKNTRI